ncbi:MAG: recombinase family protein [Actinomycetota bacterium]|nr:recombinase family protein [Actinomycetota bacterium]
MRTAIYARVSTPRQGREQTIDSQLDALNNWASENGHELSPENVYADEGYSGSRLDRPGLDALRDGAEDGVFEMIGVLSPDRLARKYAYQVLLLEEFKRAGCEVVFIHHPISDNPNDQLLLQIQGAIAEYERALLGERFRRGKLQKAREGHFIGSKAPYGYRYIPKRDGVPGHLVIDESEAELVRMLYGWLVEARMTVRQITKRLNEGPWFPRSGHHPWSPSVVHSILSNPIHAGTTYANRYRYVAPEKPKKKGRGPRSGENTVRKQRPKEEWIPISVAATIVDEDTHRLAQVQLERNAKLSFRNNKKYSYLLRCLLSCESCGLAMYGRIHKATTRQAERRIYQCGGKDPILSAREHRCQQTPAKAEELEAAIWEHVKELMREPERLLAQFEDFAHSTPENEKEDAEAKKFEGHSRRLRGEESRLVDAYQAGIIELEELKERRTKVAQQREALTAQYEQRARLRRQATQAREVLEDLEAFCGRINARLEDATLEEKQVILQLLIERIIVGEDTLEIRHVIPLHGPPGDSKGPPAPPNLRLRPDGMDYAPLPFGAGQLTGYRGLYPFVVVGDHEPHVLKALVDELPEQGGVGHALLRARDLHRQNFSEAFLVHPHAGQQRQVGDARAPTDLQVRGIQVEVRVGLLPQRPPAPLLLLLLEPPGDAAYRILADPNPAQGVGDAGYLAHRDAREVHLQHCLFDVARHALVSLEELRNELAFPVARNLQTLDLTRGSDEVTGVAAVALTAPGGGELSVARFEVLGHLLLEDLLQHGLHALPYPGLHVSLHDALEFLLRGQVRLLHSTHNLSDAIGRCPGAGFRSEGASRTLRARPRVRLLARAVVRPWGTDRRPRALRRARRAGR